MTISKKLIVAGLIGVALLNPLSTNIIADVLVAGINTLMEYLVLGSGYIMVASSTLIGVGALLIYAERNQANTDKLKKMKTAKTNKVEYLES